MNKEIHTIFGQQLAGRDGTHRVVGEIQDAGRVKGGKERGDEASIREMSLDGLDLEGAIARIGLSGDEGGRGERKSEREGGQHREDSKSEGGRNQGRRTDGDGQRRTGDLGPLLSLAPFSCGRLAILGSMFKKLKSTFRSPCVSKYPRALEMVVRDTRMYNM